MNLDSEQVRLRLTKIPYILNELRKKRRLVVINGVEVFQVQFDSRTFTFAPDAVITVGKSVADCLMADGRVIVGPPIDGPVEEVLEVIGTYNLDKGESSSPTQCPACHMEQGTTQKLIEHLMDVHDDSAKASDPFKRGPGRPRKVVDNEADLNADTK
jgi:hypothetical protein